MTLIELQAIVQNQNDVISSLHQQNMSLVSENKTLKKRCEQYELAYNQMHHQLKELMRHRFGKKSERFIDPQKKQLSLFDEDNTFFDEANAQGDASYARIWCMAK